MLYNSFVCALVLSISVCFAEIRLHVAKKSERCVSYSDCQSKYSSNNVISLNFATDPEDIYFCAFGNDNFSNKQFEWSLDGEVIDTSSTKSFSGSWVYCNGERFSTIFERWTGTRETFPTEYSAEVNLAGVGSDSVTIEFTSIPEIDVSDVFILSDPSASCTDPSSAVSGDLSFPLSDGQNDVALMKLCGYFRWIDSSHNYRFTIKNLNTNEVVKVKEGQIVDRMESGYYKSLTIEGDDLFKSLSDMESNVIYSFDMIAEVYSTVSNEDASLGTTFSGLKFVDSGDGSNSGGSGSGSGTTSNVGVLVQVNEKCSSTSDCEAIAAATDSTVTYKFGHTEDDVVIVFWGRNDYFDTKSTYTVEIYAPDDELIYTSQSNLKYSRHSLTKSFNGLWEDWSNALSLNVANNVYTVKIKIDGKYEGNEAYFIASEPIDPGISQVRLNDAGVSACSGDSKYSSGQTISTSLSDMKSLYEDRDDLFTYCVNTEYTGPYNNMRLSVSVDGEHIRDHSVFPSISDSRTSSSSLDAEDIFGVKNGELDLDIGLTAVNIVFEIKDDSGILDSKIFQLNFNIH